MALLSWDVVGPLDYAAGEEIDFNLHFEAPINTTAKKFYILGGLYTDTTYISGSLFGILKAADIDYGVNSDTYMSVWELEPEEVVDLPCKLILNRTNCLLALFLMEMVGDAVDLDNDIEVAQVTVQLAAPVSIWEQFGPLIGTVLVLSMLGVMVSGMFKKGK